MIKLKILSLSFLERDSSPRILQQMEHHHLGGFSPPYLVPGGFPACPADLHRAGTSPRCIPCRCCPHSSEPCRSQPSPSAPRQDQQRCPLFAKTRCSACIPVPTQPEGMWLPHPSSPTPRVFFPQGKLCLGCSSLQAWDQGVGLQR